ncbi:T9SS type A sorting domain-containing protein [Hymenobacter sp. NST-14]|uniref:T9SS type A sorting domain-containing protein n=1 Tax=Hymenobacter piscis TaxID=2839984 RepID=UPI001C0249CF|nr:T9SS type A sorting domain-containing protein [Hymenobacter piscis]MBT9393733.1 T9SS type A sorting domain-containing protein [Hymenobacter piscis]
MLRPGAACLSESFDSFAGGASVTLASGVVATGLGIYSTSNNAGAAPNSAQFNTTDDQLETPALSGTATRLSFFIRGNGTDAASSLLVEGYTGSAYVPIATIQPLPTSATTLTYDASSVPSLAGGTYTRFRFTYAKSNGNLAFDDLAVSCSPANPGTVTGTIDGAPFCVGQGGQALAVPFAVSNGPFAAGNVFTAYISNDGFATKTALGTLSGTTDGTISGTIPVSVASGSNYRIRVEASSPASNGTPNTADLTLINYLTSNVSSYTALATDQQAQLNWLNPASCFARVVVVARAGSPVTVKPPAGTAFTANAQFGSGTDLGAGANTGQFVVYDGPGTSAAITGLANGTTYYFKAFVTNNNGYSDGLERSATPAPVVTLTEVLLPQYLVGHAAGSSSHPDRLPYAYRATLTNLTPNATYRYYNTAVEATDGPTAVGGGATILPLTAGGFVRVAAPNLSSAGSYGSFVADGSGRYTGWFVLEPTSNSRFDGGKEVRMRIVLNDGAGGSSAISYPTTTSTVQVRELGGAGGQATGVTGQSYAPASNFVFAYDNVAGTGRPLAGTFVESDGATGTSYAQFYAARVEGVAGAWGTLTPNDNPRGIRRLAQYDLITGALTGCAATAADGTWPSGVVTASPAGGPTPLAFTGLDAPLTCAAFVGFAPITALVPEGNTGTRAVALNVTLTGTPASPLAVLVSDAGTGSATAGLDYLPFAPQPLTFAAAGTQTLTLTVNGDADMEGDETIVLELALVSGGPVTLVNTTATVTIVGDDRPSEENVLLLEENFDYAAGTVLNNANSSTATPDPATGWAVQGGTSASNTNLIRTVAGNLSRSGYPQGIAASSSTASAAVELLAGQDVNKTFAATSAPPQAVYAAALVQVASATTAGDYFLHFIDATTNSFRGRVYVRQDASDNTKINFGLGIANNTPTYAAGQFSLGVTYTVVVRYATNATSNAGDDAARLYVLDAAVSLAAEPVAALITDVATPATTDIALAAVALRQGSASSAPVLRLDNLRVATGWGAVVGQVAVTSASYVTPGSYYRLALAGGTALTTGLSTGTTAQVRVEGALDLLDGLLMTTPAHPVQLEASATVSGGSASSYVQGPLARVATGPTTLTFPIGAANAYRPLALAITNQTGTLTYTAVQQPASAPSRPLDAPLTRVSGVRYFTVTPSGPGSFGSGTIRLSYGPDDQVTDPASLRVAKSSGGGNWQTIGGTGTAAPAGTITSAPFTAFSDFALATTAADLSVNPLPVELTDFTATLQGPHALLRWSTASETNSARFEVQRSRNGHTYELVGDREAAGSSPSPRHYQWLDREVPAGLLYYRLRQLDQDGKATFSAVVTLRRAGAVAGLVAYPNPTSGQLLLQPGGATPTGVQVLDLRGRVVLRQPWPAAGRLNLSELPAGSYLVRVVTNGLPLITRVVKH